MKPIISPYSLCGEIPSYIRHENLAKIELEFLEWYRLNAPDYDATLPITFEILGCDEEIERGKLYEALKLEPTSIVLELGAGTGRDSEKLARSLSEDGFLVMQDISADILQICYRKFEVLHSNNLIKCGFDFFLSNASEIPYADSSFDRIFHFGGLNTFGDINKALSEINRVAKEGSIVVIGDEGIAPWLKNSKFGKVLFATNTQYNAYPPLDKLPETSCDVNVRWFCSEAFYFISYVVRKDPRNKANFNLEIPGIRGGSPIKRFDGTLEGISPDLRDSIYRKALKEGVSRVEFIEKVFSECLDRNEPAND